MLIPTTLEGRLLWAEFLLFSALPSLDTTVLKAFLLKVFFAVAYVRAAEV